MSRIISVIGWASTALALVIVVGLALGAETLTTRVDEVLSTSWRALGDRLASRELDAIARQLDRERQDSERIAALRDGLYERLQSLGVRRECAAARVDEECLPGGAGPVCELAHVDAAIARLKTVIARADSVLNEARRNLREREAELIALRAAADASRMDRVLASPVGNPSLWYVRVDRARELLRSTLPDGEEQATRLRPSVLP